MRHIMRTATAVLAATALAGCGDAMGASGNRLVLKFGSVAPAAASARVGADIAARAIAADELSITGTNGVLKIEDIRFIVSEVELKRAMDASCGGDDDDCEEFEGGPFLVDLPLGGGEVAIMQGEIPEGTFRAAELEVEDFEMDDDDDVAERARATELLAQLRAVYPMVPARANMVVKGTFTPTGGAARAFITYFDADVKVKQKFEPAIQVGGGDGITFRIDPTRWFTIGAQVRDLSALNERLVEFELEMKNGFVKVEHDH